VNDAPGVSADRELSEPEERELWSHYGREYSERGQRHSDSGRPAHQVLDR